MPAVVGLITAGSAWVFTKIPGPAKDWLQSDSHSKDIALITGAMSRAATVAVTAKSAAEAVTDVVEYVQSQLPSTLDKLKPTPEALITMATAAVTNALKAQ